MKNTNELSLCACGCGHKVSKPGNKFINHHHVRLNNPMKQPDIAEKVRIKNTGRQKTKEEIEKIRNSCIGINKGRNNGMYGKRPHTYGKSLSKKTRNKLSEGMKGRFSGEKNPRYGIKLSPTIKQKISKGNTGKVRTEEFKQAVSKRMSGKNHPNWRGGCTKDGYCEQWRTKELKEFIMERDGYKCMNPQCKCITNRLCIHHIDYNKKNCEHTNLITLCFSCNSIANFQRGWWKSFYRIVFERIYS